VFLPQADLNVALAFGDTARNGASIHYIYKYNKRVVVINRRMGRMDRRRGRPRSNGFYPGSAHGLAGSAGNVGALPCAVATSQTRDVL